MRERLYQDDAKGSESPLKVSQNKGELGYKLPYVASLYSYRLPFTVKGRKTLWLCKIVVRVISFFEKARVGVARLFMENFVKLIITEPDLSTMNEKYHP